MWDSLIQKLSLNTLDQFHFLRPWWGLVLIPFLLLLVFQYRAQRPDKQWSSIIAPHILEALRLKKSRYAWFNPILLYGCIFVIFTLLVMGPTWVQQPSPFIKDEAGLVIVLDVSDSMLSNDIQPSRLARAKHKIQDLLTLREGSKAALIVYAGSAHSVLPLTSDSDILISYLDAVKPSMMPLDGKFPEKALPLIQQQLANLPIPGSIVLITDGLGSNSAKAFKGYFSEHQHQLLILGVGEQADSSDTSSHAYPELDIKGLTRLANDNRGFYITITVDDADINKIHRRIENYFVAVDDENIPWLDFGYYLLFPGMLILLIWFRKGWTLQWGFAIGLFLFGVSTSDTVHANNEDFSLQQTFISWWLTPDQLGRLYFDKGNYLEAAKHFEEPMWKGLSFYMAEQFSLAAEYFSRIDDDEGLFNRANALAHAKDYLAAVRLYEYIIKQNPEHQAAEKNRAIVQDLIDEINRMSANQVDEMGDLNSSKELGKDDAMRAEGAERKILQQQELIQFSAEEVLQDKTINEMWMRSVQQNPADFLSSKFHRQLEKVDQ